MNQLKIKIYALLLLASFPLSSQTVKSAEAKAVIENLKGPKKTEKEKAPVVYNEDFSKGEELFSLNEPEKAIPYLEKALEAENADPAVYVYLGVAYYQAGDYNRSLSVCVQGLAKDNTDKKVLAYNAGNSCYAMGNYMRADASYAISMREDETYAPPVLNRANAQLKMDHLEDAKNNYVKYLELDKESPQKEKIENLILLLEEEIARRAKEGPELINPDDFVENEKMETVEAEKVIEEIPLIAEEKPVSSEKIEAAPPSLPVEVKKEYDGEKITEKPPVFAEAETEEDSSDREADKVSEKMPETITVLPPSQIEKSAEDNDDNDKTEEKLSESVVNLPEVESKDKEKKNEKLEKIDPKLLKLSEPVKDEKKKSLPLPPPETELEEPGVIETTDIENAK